MSQYFFDRVIRLNIGKYNSSNVLVPVVTLTEPLRISFDATKTEFSIVNMATVTVNNLADSTRNKIKSGMIAILEAGYAEMGGLQLLFHGDVFEVNHNIEKPEIITTITICDGHAAIRKKKISVSYKKGSSIAQIIKDCTKAIGLPMNTSFDSVQLPKQSISETASFTGNAAQWLDKVCGENGLQWSVQNGKIKIYEFGKTDNLPPLQSVLIGSPKRLFRNDLSASIEDFSGYEFNALLMPQCEPGSAVTFTSKEVTKSVRLQVAQVKHTGDNYGDDWKTNVRARDIWI